MNALVVAGLLKRIYLSFNIETFSNRLRLQKIIYLLQECKNGINLGFPFSYYLYGPYSAQLARSSFNIPDFHRVKRVGFDDEITEKNFEEFKEFIEPHKNSDFWLEVATSIHALKETYASYNKSKIIDRIRNKRSEFNSKTREIEKIWDDIDGWLI